MYFPSMAPLASAGSNETQAVTRGSVPEISVNFKGDKKLKVLIRSLLTSIGSVLGTPHIQNIKHLCSEHTHKLHYKYVGRPPLLRLV